MDDLKSFLNRKMATKPITGSESQDEGMAVVVLLDNIDCRDLLKFANGAKTEILFFVLANDMGHSDFPKDLEFAIRAAAEFDEDPKLAFFVVKNKGIVPTRRSFLLECGAYLSARTPADLFEQLKQQVKQRSYNFKMVSEEVYDLMRCAELFIDRNYEACARQGLLALGKMPNAQITLMTLISMQRLHQNEKAAELVEQLSPELAGDSWLATLVQLTLGELDLFQVLPKAGSPQQVYQAYFYAGARFNTKGQLEQARRAFANCASIPTDCIEKAFVDLEVYEPPIK